MPETREPATVKKEVERSRYEIRATSLFRGQFKSTLQNHPIGGRSKCREKFEQDSTMIIENLERTPIGRFWKSRFNSDNTYLKILRGVTFAPQ